MTWQLPAQIAIDDQLCSFIDRYRDNYLAFFLDRFASHHTPGHRGGYFNINSVTGEPYAHNYCYSWTDGRSLGELMACYVARLGNRVTIRAYTDHLYHVLVERFELNGYFPHVVDDRTNLAADHPMNVKIGPGASSYSHVFVLNGLLQYALIFDVSDAWELANRLLDDLRQALQNGAFLEGAEPRPAGQRAQGPFMIALGALVDVLETMGSLFARSSADFECKAGPLSALGRSCLDYIRTNHYREDDDAFWEVSRAGEAVRDDEGRVVTDPGHTIEFTGFAARFASFVEAHERQEILDLARRIFLWAARRGFHPTRDLVYKNVDRDTGRPIMNELVADISDVVSPSVFERHFQGQRQAVRVATFPWWVPMELVAAGSIVRQVGDPAGVDLFIIRALTGLFEYYPNDRINGLCYQNIGDGFFDYIDVPPATASLDLMHSHRSMRVFLREVRGRPPS